MDDLEVSWVEFAPLSESASGKSIRWVNQRLVICDVQPLVRYVTVGQTYEMTCSWSAGETSDWSAGLTGSCLILVIDA